MKTLACQADVAEIRRRLGSLTESDARQWGVMTASEMVCHLREAYRLALGERAAAMQRMPLPPRVIKWIALRLPMPWPKDLKTVPELEVGGVGLAPAVFAEDRDAAIEFLARFADTPGNAHDHPIFGRMRPSDWMRWGYLHADHHLRQFGR